MDTVVLAYSGRLSTAVCVHWLKYKMGMRVIAFIPNIGQAESLEPCGELAIEGGADSSNVKDLRSRFATHYILPALRAGAISVSGSHLANALARPLIVEEMVKIAREQGARFLAHGYDREGNDQLRFATSMAMLDNNLKVISPLQEARLTSRKDQLAYAEKYDLPTWDEPAENTIERIENLWGVSSQWHGAQNTWDPAPAEVYTLTCDPGKAPAEPETVEIGFEKGLPRSLAGVKKGPVAIIQELSRMGARHGVGRLEIVENRLIGVKRREFYESPAASLLHTAHKALEGLVLGDELRRFQVYMSQKYGEVVYNGMWFSQLRESLDSFFTASQNRVSGKVRLQILRGQCWATGVQSVYSRYQPTLSEHLRARHSTVDATKGFLDLLSFAREAETAHWLGE